MAKYNLDRIMLTAVLSAGIATTGCAKFWDQTEARGGIVGSSKAPYVVIKQSGGVITDVYKLPDAIIQSEAGSDGWLFLDQNSRPVHIGGDMKSIRFKAVPRGVKTEWNCYFEFHREFETKSYEELYGQAAKECVASLPK